MVGTRSSTLQKTATALVAAHDLAIDGFPEQPATDYIASSSNEDLPLPPIPVNDPASCAIDNHCRSPTPTTEDQRPEPLAPPRDDDQDSDSQQIEHTLSADLDRLLNSQTFADLGIKCGSIHWKVHRAILASRSPVLMRRLQDDDFDHTKHFLTISPDVEPFMHPFLRALYTGTYSTTDLYRGSKPAALALKRPVMAGVDLRAMPPATATATAAFPLHFFVHLLAFEFEVDWLVELAARKLVGCVEREREVLDWGVVVARVFPNGGITYRCELDGGRVGVAERVQGRIREAVRRVVEGNWAALRRYVGFEEAERVVMVGRWG